MFEIPQPAMACNSADLEKGFVPYKMWNTRTVTRDVPIKWLIQNIVDVAKSAPESYLKSLVLNAHGTHGQLLLGSGIFESTPPSIFAPLKGYVRDIFVVSCALAGAGPSKYDRSRILDGWELCIGLAKASGAYLYASKKTQRQSKQDRRDGIPYGYIDDVEGPAVVFFPDGSHQPWDGKAPLKRQEPPYKRVCSPATW